MEYELKKPLQVYNKDKGEYEKQSNVVVSFTGRKGLQVIKRLQDEIFKVFTEQGKSRPIEKDVQKAKEDDKIVTVDELFDALEMTGQSSHLFQEIAGSLKAFGKIGETKINDDLLDEMDMDDLDSIYEAVIKHFLLPKITSRMNSMKK